MPDPVTEFMPFAQTVVSLVLLPVIIAGTFILAGSRRRYLRRPLDHLDYDGPLLRRPWRGMDVLMIMLLLAATQALIHQLVNRPDTATEPRPLVLMLTGLGFQAATLLYIRLLMQRHRCGWRTAFGAEHPIRSFRLAVLFYLGMWPVLLAVIPAYHALLRGLGFSIDWQDAMVMLTADHSSPAVMAALLVMALVMAPVSEELLFRGILLPVLRRRIGVWPAVILSSLVFAALHQHTPSLAGLFIVSVACSLAAIVSGSVVTAIWLHVLFNAGNTLLALTLTGVSSGG